MWGSQKKKVLYRGTWLFLLTFFRIKTQQSAIKTLEDQVSEATAERDALRLFLFHLFLFGR